MFQTLLDVRGPGGVHGGGASMLNGLSRRFLVLNITVNRFLFDQRARGKKSSNARLGCRLRKTGSFRQKGVFQTRISRRLGRKIRQLP